MKDFPRNTEALHPIPLGGRAVGGGQGSKGGIKGAQAVTVQNGFFAGLAPRTARFFSKQFSAPFPHNIGIWTSPSGLTTVTNQRTVTLGAFDVPVQQQLVIKDVRFRVFQDNGLGLGVSEVPPGALAGFVSFNFKVGGGSLIEMTNNAGQGSFGVGGAPTNISEIPATFTTIPPTSTQQQLDEDGGSFSDRFGQDGKFNLYAQPGQTVQAQFQILRAPEIDVRSVAFELTGYLFPDTVLKDILGFEP